HSGTRLSSLPCSGFGAFRLLAAALRRGCSRRGAKAFSPSAGAGFSVAAGLVGVVVFAAAARPGQRHDGVFADCVSLRPGTDVEAAAGSAAFEFFANRTAAQFDLRGVWRVPGAVVFEFRAAGEFVAGAVPAAGGFGGVAAVFAGGVFRAAAAHG